MKIETVITLVIVIGLVWGGFGFFLFKAFKFEKMKRENGEAKT
jgi:hypothetical protein